MQDRPYIASAEQGRDLLKQYLVSSGKGELVGIPILELPHFELEVEPHPGSNTQTVRLRRIEHKHASR